jgi:virulence factor
MKDFLIRRYKELRKRKLLSGIPSPEKTYAFIGVGAHSIQNIYPVLKQMDTRLKYIHSRSIRHAEAMCGHYPGAIPVDSLDTVLADDSISGVFVSSLPHLHADYAEQLLAAGKYIWIEKPLGECLAQVSRVAGHSRQGCCMVGLQKRYSPVNTLLQKKLSRIISYRYTCSYGSYPEGDVYSELFIHAIDNCVHLFGEAIGVLQYKVLRNGDITQMILLQHKNGVVGSLELSTHYSWKFQLDALSVNTEAGLYLYQVDYPYGLSFTKYPRSLLKPMERIMNTPVQTVSLLDTKQHMPVNDYNSFYLNGYTNELIRFTRMVEYDDLSFNLSPPASVVSTYEVLEKLKQG